MSQLVRWAQWHWLTFELYDSTDRDELCNFFGMVTATDFEHHGGYVLTDREPVTRFIDTREPSLFTQLPAGIEVAAFTTVEGVIVQ